MTKNIQVDMFEVRLGAALLMQFRLETGKVVRVLADAGVSRDSGYPPEHVYNKLFNGGHPTDVWTGFSSETPRIELIIGTHYDADHLLGLVPVILDTGLEIDEIWLPPVQDDDDDLTAAKVAGGSSNLVNRLEEGNTEEVLQRYLDRRKESILAVDAVYERGLRHTPDDSPLMARRMQTRQRLQEMPARRLGDMRENNDDDFFEASYLLAMTELGLESHSHCDADDESADDLFRKTVDRISYPEAGSFLNSPLLGRAGHNIVAMSNIAIAWSDAVLEKADHSALETIRKSEAGKAINAKSLAKVVAAIKTRKANGGGAIRIRSESISQGNPRYFRWSANAFQEANGNYPAELGFHLMGPSQELVAELHDKLPIGTYILAFREKNLSSGSVTPSNRLSYVMRFHLKQQNLLISGDAGFSDFAPKHTNNYYPDLTALLQPLHVVQVAHHGGLNHRFYDALRVGKYPDQEDWSFMLLSHAVHDATRPQPVFSTFAALFRRDDRHDVSILFTSRPKAAKVATILDLIHPVVPALATDDQGDVRLSFPHEADKHRAGTRWRVEKHAVQP